MKSAAVVAVVLLALSGAADAAVNCTTPIACTAIYAPVCGSDGKTYGNACELAAATCKTPSLSQRTEGECAGGSGGDSSTPTPSPTSECPVEFCTAIGYPVCGSNNKTYGNPCELQVAKCAGQTTLKIAYYGSCNAAGSTGTGMGAGTGNGTGGGTGNGTGNGGGNGTGRSNSSVDTNAPSPVPSPISGAAGVRAAVALVASSALFLFAMAA